MNKNLTFLSVAALSLMGVSCSAEKDFQFESKGNTTIFAQSEEVGCQTRTAVDNTEYESGEIGINWIASDKIGVFGNAGSTNVAFSNNISYETPSTTFSGDLKSGETPVYAYFPYSATAGNDATSIKGNLSIEQKYNSMTRALDSDWKVGKAVDGGNKFSFTHIFPFLQFVVNAEGTDLAGERLESVSLKIEGAQLGGTFSYDLVNDKLTVDTDATANTVTMQWTDAPQLSAATFYGYMSCMPADLSGKEIEITLLTNYHKVVFTAQSKAGALTPNNYYTVPLILSKFKDSWTKTVREDKVPQGEYVSALESKLACANWVFTLPDTPFMHKIRVPDAGATINVYGLPEGLTWNARRSLVEGKVAAEGEYTYTVFVTKPNGETYTEGVKLTVSNSLHQPTPHMGWQSWNVLEMNISESSLKEIADALVNNGFKDAGYIWLGIDDSWQATDGSRDESGMPVVNSTKFPNGFKTVTDYIHSKGLKAGIYSDAGTETCASGSQAGGTMLGAYGYEDVHARYFTEWGFDKLKEDWFWSGHGDNNGALDASSTPLAFELYKKMGDGIKANGNKILLSMCEWGLHEPWKWGPEAGASSWRMSYDLRDGWMGAVSQNGNANSNSDNSGGIGLYNTIHLMRDLWPYAGVNRFNDPDMLCVGIRGTGSSSNDLVYGVTKSTSGWPNKTTTYKKDGKTYTGMSDAEYETEFAMWCMWSAPLLMTLDVRKTDLNAHDLALLKNKELIAINQDPMGQQAEYIKADGNVWYFCKDLANGDVAIAAVNLGDSSASYSISKGDYDALYDGISYTSRELISLKESTVLDESSPITGTLAAHATVVYRLKKQ